MTAMEILIDRADLAATGASLRRSGKRIVFTNGCFDLLHPGHVRLLARSASFGDCLLVGINDDESVRRLKGDGRPVYTAAERAELLLALRWVDLVTIFCEDTPRETIECLRPDVLVKGGEYLERDIVGAKFVKSYGGAVVRVPMKRGHSSRSIVRRIMK
jgi:D-beta-D-heptose 7-phosphate kinase/D-beta-D-heptose 1-phosphate adenosyltransferase